MHILIAIFLLAALVWLFSSAGNFKRNLKLTVIYMVLLTVVFFAIAGSIAANMPLIAGPVLVFAGAFLWRLHSKPEPAAPILKEPSFDSEPFDPQQYR